MTTRSYQTTKRNIRRSRRIARSTDVLAGNGRPVIGGVLINRISFSA